MSKQNIDDLFKEGLDGKGLPYKAQYWKDMEALLVPTVGEQARSPWWNILGMTLLVGVSILYIILPVGKEQTQDVPSVIRSISPNQDPIEQVEVQNRGTVSPAPVMEQVEVPIHTEVAAPSPVEPFPSAEGNTPPNSFAMEVHASPDDSTEEPFQDAFARLKSYGLNGFPFASFQASSQRFPSIPAVYTKWSHRISLETGPLWMDLNERSAEQAWHRKGATAWSLDVGYRLKNGAWSIGTGLGIQQRRQLTDLSTSLEKATYDTSLHLIERNYIRRPDGSFVALLGPRIDTQQIWVDSAICQDCSGRSTYLSIPLNVAYALQWRGFRMSVQAGLRYNIRWSAQGSDVDPLTADLIALEDALQRHHLQAETGLLLQYRILPEADLQLSYAMLSDLNSAYKADLSPMRMHRLGLGLVWDLFP